MAPRCARQCVAVLTEEVSVDNPVRLGDLIGHLRCNVGDIVGACLPRILATIDDLLELGRHCKDVRCVRVPLACLALADHEGPDC